MLASLYTRLPSSISHNGSPDEESNAIFNLIFMVTGNPGLISYYTTFLSTLYKLFADVQSEKHVFHIYGQSLAGFEQNDRPPTATSVPYSLENQIDILYRSLSERTISSGPRKGQKYDNIILMGHSVGTYIIMELLTRLRKNQSLLNVTAGILLFPTIMHIAKSPSGVKAGSLFNIPGFPKGVGAVVKTLLWPLPRPALKWLVRKVTGMSEEGAETTAQFLTSNMGIWQALHMAKDELESITEDKWADDIWGVEHTDIKSKSDVPKLVLYFGEEDHWVANDIRDEIIAARGRGIGDSSSSKPLMLIDGNNVPHSFCIHHSEQIAEKVKVWIEDMIDD